MISSLCLSMISAQTPPAFVARENRFPLFRIMLYSGRIRASKNRHNGSETVDLGIKGRRAIVCASSKGLGRACAMALAAEGVHVTVTARGAEALRRQRPKSAKPTPASRCASRRRHHHAGGPRGRADGLSRPRHPDQQCRRPAAGRFPQLDPRRLDQGARRQHADADRTDQATVDGMMARKFGRIVNITSAAVKAPIEVLGLSNGARTGLTGFVAGIVAQDRDRQRHHQRPAAGAVRY